LLRQFLSFDGHPAGAKRSLVVKIIHLKTTSGVSIWIAAGAFSLLPGLCSAQSTCQWLNPATASGVLGGSATMEVNNTGVSTGVCVFRFQDEAQNNTLRISIIKAERPENAGKEMMPYESKCTSSGQPLKGVGNEAILCASDTGKWSGELVVGRVRDNIFTVVINDATGDNPAATKDDLADKALEIAKQVAGILF
jgi:hypothetical protein